jgi:hypothetical protein
LRTGHRYNPSVVAKAKGLAQLLGAFVKTAAAK